MKRRAKVLGVDGKVIRTPKMTAGKAPARHYLGFKKLEGELARRPGVRDPGGLTAYIGRRKYGARKFNAAARAGRKLGG